jgi:hypothetical protein
MTSALSPIASRATVDDHDVLKVWMLESCLNS